MGGGGATTGIAFPDASGWDNPTAVYSRWLTHDSHLKGFISSAAISASPYDGETAPDPDDYLDSDNTWHSQGRLNVLNAVVDAYGYSEAGVEAIHSSERGSITSMIESALEAAGDTLEGTALSNMRDAYAKKVKKSFLQGMSRMAASMADINAVNSSAFIFAMASLEKQMLDDVDLFESTQGMEVFKLYVQAFTTSFHGHLNAYVQENGMQLNSNQAAAGLQVEANRTRHAADLQEHRYQMTLDAEEILWHMKIYQHGANLLAASGGAAMPAPEMSTMQSGLSGALSGAGAMGASTGGNPLMMGIGGAVGLIGGLFK